MKSLDEKKLLARMSRNMGQPDLALEESIRKEEALIENLFRLKEIQPIQPSIPILKEELPKPAETNIVPKEQELIKQTVAAISSPKFAKSAVPDLQSKEIEGLRKQIADIVQKLGTLSWGSGGTGVVRFLDLDDHQHPEDVKYLKFNTNGPDVDPPDGSISWNPTEECMDVHQPDGTTLQVGLENYIRVKNITGSVLPSGTVVRFTGINGGANPTAGPLTANSTFNPVYTIGVMTEDLANNDTGRATTFGKVRAIDTTGTSVGETWLVGDILFAHPSIAGGLTKDQPTAPDVAVTIAAVTKVGVTDGELLVRPEIRPRLYYGSFSATNNQPLTNASTAYTVNIDTVNFASGHRIGANNDIISDYHGLFKYDVNYNVTSSNSSRTYVYMWIRKNNVDQPNTALRFSIESNGGEAVPHASYTLSMQPGDHVQLMIASDKTSVSLLASAATAFSPRSPAALITVSQINQ